MEYENQRERKRYRQVQRDHERKEEDKTIGGWMLQNSTQAGKCSVENNFKSVALKKKTYLAGGAEMSFR